MVNKTYSQMTPAERLAIRIAQNRAIDAKIAAPKVVADAKPAYRAVENGLRREVGVNAPYYIRTTIS